MWWKIKSPFILEKIFNHFDIIKKLTTIIYNKAFQRKLKLDLIDYKRFSGRYKKVHNDITEEYDSLTDNLIFIGQYLDGKRNGEGKEYNSKCDLIFEGIYMDGKKYTGKAKKYDDYNDQLILEYEYSNGIIDGEAKEYDKYSGELLFSGQYLNGKRNGNIKLLHIKN